MEWHSGAGRSYRGSLPELEKPDVGHQGGTREIAPGLYNGHPQGTMIGQLTRGCQQAG